MRESMDEKAPPVSVLQPNPMGGLLQAEGAFLEVAILGSWRLGKEQLHTVLSGLPRGLFFACSYRFRLQGCTVSVSPLL